MNTLLIGIDGCRFDSMLLGAPNIINLMKNSVSSVFMSCSYPAFSGPGWATILTGMNVFKTGILDNKCSLLNNNEKYFI